MALGTYEDEDCGLDEGLDEEDEDCGLDEEDKNRGLDEEDVVVCCCCALAVVQKSGLQKLWRPKQCR